MFKSYHLKFCAEDVHKMDLFGFFHVFAEVWYNRVRLCFGVSAVILSCSVPRAFAVPTGGDWILDIYSVYIYI